MNVVTEKLLCAFVDGGFLGQLKPTECAVWLCMLRFADEKCESSVAIKDWLTPPEIIRELGPFDLDPCSPVDRPWDTATRHYTIHDDGLKMPWEGTVWLNPPYGPETGKWLSRLADHGNGIALIFARTETRFFHAFSWERAAAMLFFKGRLHFHFPDGRRAGTAGAPSVLIAYGEECARRLKNSHLVGRFIGLN